MAILNFFIFFTMLGFRFGFELHPLYGKETATSKLKTHEISVGSVKLVVELALTPEEQEVGLMHRQRLGDHEGMLFVFPDERPRTFWMKNTFIPLSLGFFDQHGVLKELVDLDAVKSEMQVDIPRYQSRSGAKYVLEVNRGWFKKNKIRLGDRLKPLL